MTTISGVRIHPGFFNQRPKRNEYRVSAEPTFKVKKTVTLKPSNPRAKHAMPIIAVIAAVAATSSAIGVAAAAGGFFASAAATFATITAIGAVVGAVGAVTGNKNLMKIGAIVGIAGAVGGFAAGAGFFGEGGTFGSTAPDASSVSNNPTGYEGDAGDALGGAGQGSGMVNKAVPTVDPYEADMAAGSAATNVSAQPVAPPTDAPVDLGATTPATPTATPPSADVASAMPTATPPTTPTAADQITANAQGSTGYDYDINNPAASLKSADVSQAIQDGRDSMNIGGEFKGNLQTPKIAGMPSEPTSFDSLMGMFGKMGSATSDFAKANPMIASSIFSGIAGAADSSQRNLRDAQANSLNTDADMKKQLMKNQSTVGGPIDWTKTFKPGGMIGKGK